MIRDNRAMIAAAGATLLSVLAYAVPTATAADPLILDDVRWSASSAAGGGDGVRLRLRYGTSSSEVALDGARREFAAARGALAGGAGPIGFNVAHEAGTLNCTGTMVRPFEGEGRCSFAADTDYERKLAARGLTPERRSDMLAMLLLDATITLADGLTAAGVKPGDADDLIAAAALDVSPAYVRELQAGAMTLTSVDDAVACKALGVDGAYVRGLAEAGYAKLDAAEVISMKALGVTPDYARAMNAAVKGGR